MEAITQKPYKKLKSEKLKLLLCRTSKRFFLTVQI